MLFRSVDPINAYGVTKAAGEMIIGYRWPKHFIVRSCGLYGVAGSADKGGNFVETMLRLAAGDKPIKVVDDQVLTPTATWPLAAQICELAATDAFGTYHATCQGQCSWFEFAEQIVTVAGASANVTRCRTADMPRPAKRPAYSVLRSQRGVPGLPDWRQGLEEYLAARVAT